MGYTWATGGLHESYRQFVHFGDQFGDCLFRVNVPCHIGSPARFECSALPVSKGVPHDDLFAYLIHTGIVGQGGKGVTAVVRCVVHVEPAHTGIPVTVVIDCSCIVVTVFVSYQIFSVLGEPVLDQRDDRFVYGNNPVLLKKGYKKYTHWLHRCRKYGTI